MVSGRLELEKVAVAYSFNGLVQNNRLFRSLAVPYTTLYKIDIILVIVQDRHNVTTDQ